MMNFSNGERDVQTDTLAEAEIAKQIIAETEKTKRLWLALAFVAMLAALLILVYTPPGGRCCLTG